ncbi:MAG TPA: tetratricopeptide repeat protein [Candidatus Eisenbacteria bacterium]|nr:tetratricopeptide repeat protein [Candidatus Eisenbacteria bacterium]
MRFLAIALALSLAAGAAQAMPSGSKPDPPSSSSNPSTPSSNPQATGPRVDAERTYALAYDEVAKGNKELAAGKTKNAQKKFKKALGYAESSTSYDANYFEAWNLVGYCARKLGDYDKAFTAYDKSLAINPEYAPAREYLGEAYLEKGNLQKAHEQLVILEKSGEHDEEASRLFAAIEAYKKAHPEAASASAPSAPAAATAPPDSTSGR